MEKEKKTNLQNKEALNPPESNEKNSLLEKEFFRGLKIPLLISCFLFGTFTSFGFQVVMISAQDDAHFFHYPDQTGSYGLVLMISALACLFIVSRCCTSISIKVKILSNTFARVFAFGLLYLSFIMDDLRTGFWVSIAASVLLGALTMVDHIVFISFLKDFPSYCLKGCLSGQGFSGLFSTLLYLGMKELGIQFKYVCLVMVPLNLSMILIFLWMDCLGSGYLEKKKELEQQELGDLNIVLGKQPQRENHPLLDDDADK